MQLFRFRAWPLLALLLVLTFPLTGLVHALVPHNDTHTLTQVVSECETVYGFGHCNANQFNPADGHDKTLWNFIHSLLAHEAKKVLLVEAGFALLSYVLAACVLALRAVRIERRRTDTYEDALSSGIFAFRRFG